LADISGRTNIQIDALNLSRSRKRSRSVWHKRRQRMLLLTLIDEIHFGPSKYGRLGRHAKGLILGLDDPNVPMPAGFDEDTFAMGARCRQEYGMLLRHAVSEFKGRGA